MLGIILSLGSSVFFGANSVIARRGMFRFTPNYVATISILRGLLFFLIVGGLTTSIAQLLRYVSFGYGSVVVVSLMLRTQPVWVIVFSFLFIRQHERFSRWVFSRNGMIIIGTILVMMS